MTSLKSHMATQDAEVTTLNMKINTLNTEMNSKNTELNSVNNELNSVNTDVIKLKAEVLTQHTQIQTLQSRKGKYMRLYNSYNSSATVYSLFANYIMKPPKEEHLFFYLSNESFNERERGRARGREGKRGREKYGERKRERESIYNFMVSYCM